MDQPNKTVLVAVNDIFFYTKLRDALLPQGYQLERARSQDEVREKASTLRPAALVINMNDERLDAFKALEQVNATDGPNTVPVLAFANHEEGGTFRRAKELGVSRIVTRNEFSARTRELVEEVIGCQPSAVSDEPGTST